MKQISEKQAKKTEAYNQAKIEKKEILIIEGQWVGCFSNKSIPFNVMPGFHHLEGRDGSLMTDIDNILPIQNNSYHHLYHHENIENLLKLGWYNAFLIRMKHNHTKIYNIELKRMNKANIISDVELLEMWLD